MGNVYGVPWILANTSRSHSRSKHICLYEMQAWQVTNPTILRGQWYEPRRRFTLLRRLDPNWKMLIARACPIMCIYRKHGGQRGYRGHVLNLPQDVQGFLDKLSADPSTIPVLVNRRHGTDQTYTDCRVRRAKVLRALQWLQVNNHFYKDITIDEAILH